MRFINASITAIIIIVSSYKVYAIDPTMTLSVSPHAIGTNETANITVNVIHGNIKDVPKLSEKTDEFTLEFRGQSTQRNISIINGNLEVQMTYSYIFQLIPKKTGTIMIPSFSGTTKNGKEIYSTSGSIQVKDTDTLKAPKKNSFGFSSSGFFNDDPGESFLQWQLSSGEVIQNTGFIADLYIYSENPNFLNNLNHIEMPERPQFEGGVLYEIIRPENSEIITETFGYDTFYGKLYKRYVGFPLEKFTLRLHPPYLVNNNGPFSVRFQGNYIDIKSIPITDTLTYVGNQLEVDLSLSSNTIDISEEGTLTLTIEGDGNTDFFVNPFRNLKLTNLFISEPESSLEVSEENNQIYMTKTLTYTIIPRKLGEYRIPSVKLTYTDKTGRAQEKLSPEILFQATGIEEKTETESYSRLSEKGNLITYRSGLEIALCSLILGIFIMLGSWIHSKKHNRLAHDHNFARFSGAKTRLSKILSESHQAFSKKNYKDSVRLLRQSILYFCSDKFSLATSSSPQEIMDFLDNKEIVFEEKQKFLNLLSTLEFYAFAGTPKEDQITEYFQEAEKILDSLEKINI